MTEKLTRRTTLIAGATLAAAGTVGLGGREASAQEKKGGSATKAPATGATKMNTRKIPKSGEQLPVIGMGTSRTFEVSPKSPELETLRKVLDAHFAAGATVIDSSPMYGRAEEVIGELLEPAERKGRAWIATKVWTTGKQQGIEQMTASMKKLRVEKIDLMQVHNLQDTKTHLETLRAWKQEGKIRYLGVTHYQRSAFDELESLMRKEKLDFVQLPYSISMREAEKRLLPAAQETGTAVLVMRPFERGELFAQTKGKPLPDFAKEFDCESWAQFFLKFILGHPAVTCPIPATANPKHVADNLKAGFGRYPDEAMRKKMIAHLGL